MKHYDVIVAGAGPAGNSAAFALAKAGASVALLEKQTLPRHKTCGGGMPVLVSQLLELEELRDLAPDAFVEADTRFMRHTFHFADPMLAPMNPENLDSGERELSLWMVQRSVFDYALAQRAASAGAELRDALPIRSVERAKNQPVTVRAEGKSGAWEATCDTLIGADGANGVVAKAAGLRRERTLAIAIEAEVPHIWGAGIAELRPEVCHLEFGAVKRGYAWVFPKGDHLNVGAGVFRPRREDGRGDGSVREELHKAILDYLVMLGVPKRADELTYHAHPLPIWNGMDKIQTPDNRILLAGDAAGLINPFLRRRHHARAEKRTDCGAVHPEEKPERLFNRDCRRIPRQLRRRSENVQNVLSVARLLLSARRKAPDRHAHRHAPYLRGFRLQ